MNNDRAESFIGIDIGSSAVRVVVLTSNEPDGRLSVIGSGVAPNLGMRRGSVVHVDDVAEAVVSAVTTAERLSGIRINRATVNINGTHVLGSNSKGVVATSGFNRPITEDDRVRVEQAATVVKMPLNREIVQVFAKGYTLDGQSNIKDPVGMTGVRLEVDTQLITASTPSLRLLDSVLDKAQVAVDHRTVSSLASVEAVMTREQKEAGAVLVDIGAGTTNVAVLEDGEVQHIGVIPIGGNHLTNDLAIGLKTDLDIAEQVKLRFGGIETKPEKVVKLKLGTVEYSFDSRNISLIIESRMEELMEYIDKELSKVHKSGKLPGGVIFAGGGSKIDGLSEFAREQLSLPARIGKLQPLGGLLDSVNDPSYFTSIGLAMLDMFLPSSGQGDSSKDKFLGFFDSLKQRFKF